jgi:glycosyltransferase involved in cell wall biosynthesis
MPAVTIIIPCYNRSRELKRAVESVLEQKYQDFQLIVVDDGSEEDLAGVCNQLSERNHRYVKIPRGGVAGARNYGVSLSDSEWIAFLDSDDEWLPTKLSSQIEFHNSHPQYVISQTEEIWIRRGMRVNQKKIHLQPDGEAFEMSLERCCITPSSVMIRRDLFNDLRGFDEQLRVCEDYDLWLRITANHEVPLIKEKLIVKYGGHEDQLSHSVQAIDRFRVYSLLKFLSNNPGTEQSKKDLVIKTIKKKSEILLSGAKKHQNPKTLVYQEILARLENNQFDYTSDLINSN